MQLTDSFGADLANIAMGLKGTNSPITKDRIAKPFWEKAKQLEKENEKIRECVELALCSMNCNFPDGWEKYGFDDFPSEAEVLCRIKELIGSHSTNNKTGERNEN